MLWSPLFFFFSPFTSALIFIISFLLLTVGFSFLPFLVALGVKLGYLFDFSLVSWGKLVLLMNLSLSTAFTESHRFCFFVFSFSFISTCIFFFFISSVICCLFRSVLFSLHRFVFLIGFFFFPCSWHLILPRCGQKRCLKWFQVFWIYQG